MEITLLRKGPEHLPASGMLLLAALVLWVLSSLAALALIDRFTEDDFFLGMFSGIVALCCYAAIVVISGKAGRMLQTLSAVTGAGAIIAFAFVAEYVLMTPLLGGTASSLMATVILLWSVPVEGHIISRAVDRHWYVGILLAVAVFIIQYAINIAVTTRP